MFRRLFLDHPASVGESYGEHMQVAASVGATMVAAGLACFVHALVPAWCKTTGSRTIAKLHARTVKHRGAKADEIAGERFGAWEI